MSRSRRDRDQVAAVARRRMALLEAELAGLRSAGADAAASAGPGPDGAGGTVGRRPPPREPGQHRQQVPPSRSPSRPPAPSPSSRPPLRAGRPGLLDDGRPAFGERPALETAPLRLRHDDVDVDRDDDGADLLTGDDEHVGRAPGARPGREPTAVGPAAWVADRLPETLRGRVALSGRTVLALGVVAALAVGAVVWTTLRAGAGGDPVPAATVRAPAAVSPAAPAAAAPGATGSASSSPGATPVAGGVVVVDVAGKVRRPGIVTLPAGSRVHQAIERAGGPRPGVRLTSLNLARVLVDGEQILVGVAGATGASAPAPAAGSSSGPSGGQLVNLNTADAAALDTLPGVGEVTAQKIIDYRTSHGGFTSVDQLLDVDGIGEKTLADIKPGVTV